MPLPSQRGPRVAVYTLLLIALWLVPAILITSQLAVDAHVMKRALNPWRTFLGQLPRWMIWVPLTPAIVWFSRRIPFDKGKALRRIVQHGGGAIGVSLITNAAWALQGYINTGDSLRILYAVYYPVTVNWTLAIYTAIVGTAIAIDSTRRSALLREQLAKSRLAALSQQIQPHFLFNTLHTVAGLVRAGRGTDAVEMIAQLSRMLRDSLDLDQSPEAPLGQEMESVDRYLAIQQVRFSDRLEIRRSIAPETLAVSVPRFLLQPLVENALNHGIAAQAGPGFLELRAQKLNGSLRLSVVNSGPALPTGWSVANNGRVGLRNTAERMEQLYGGAGSFTLANGPAGTVEAGIVLPWNIP